MKTPAAIVVLVVGGALVSAQGTSKWVCVGDDGRLQYGRDGRGNRITT